MLPGGEDRAGTDVNRLLLVRLRGGGVGVGHTTRINCVILHARVVAFGRQGSQIQMTRSRLTPQSLTRYRYHRRFDDT